MPQQHKGLLVRLDAKPGKDAEVEELFESAVLLAMKEPATTTWFAIRFGRSEYGIFDVFPDDAGREAHLSGPVAQALRERADALFAAPPRIQKLDVLADKLPLSTPTLPIIKGLLLTFQAKAGHERDVEQFLREAEQLVQDEPKTTVWFALRLEDGCYGIFDVFPDNGGRFAHLTGHVPRALAMHALTWLGSVPHLEMCDVLAEKLDHLAIARQAESVGATG
jgi:quinol monooxygenase YgiN